MLRKTNNASEQTSKQRNKHAFPTSSLYIFHTNTGVPTIRHTDSDSMPYSYDTYSFHHYDSQQSCVNPLRFGDSA